MVRSESQRFSHIGGHPAADLINTVRWRLDPQRRTDDLGSFADALAWAEDSHLIPAPERRPARRDDSAEASALADIVRLREDLYESLVRHDTGAADRIRATTSRALHAAHAVHRGNAWEWEFEPSPQSVVHRIALGTFTLLTDGGEHPLKQCSDDACGWVFVDASRLHNRRWCVSSDCGNRNRVRAHSTRTRDGARAG